MKTANIGNVLHKAYTIIDAMEFAATDDNGEDVTLTGSTINFNYENEPYTLYIGGSGSVTIHSYNDEIEVPF